MKYKQREKKCFPPDEPSIRNLRASSLFGRKLQGHFVGESSVVPRPSASSSPGILLEMEIAPPPAC